MTPTPHFTKLERFELFTTHAAYYLIGCCKANTDYRVLRLDRFAMMTTQGANKVDLIQCSLKLDAARAMDVHNNQTNNISCDNNNNDIHIINSANNPAVSVDPTKPTAVVDRRNKNVAGVDNSSSSSHSKQHQGTDQAGNSSSSDETQYSSKLSSFCTEDPCVYTHSEIQEMLDKVHEGNKHLGGLRPVVKAYGIVGFVQFLDCYYLTLITKRVKVGCIGVNGIYSIKSTETFPLRASLKNVDGKMMNPHGSEVIGQTGESNVLLNLWNQGKRSVGLGLTTREIAELRYQGLYQITDLTKNFFFSYSYDMTRSLQENFLSMTSRPFPPPPSKDMYSWNFFLTREMDECTSAMTSFYWVLPIIHGAFVQRKLSDYGRSLNITLLARRSRHFAGTRYLKRGVSDLGKVANDVEHEQILHDETSSAVNGEYSSYLQMRGSLPTYWTQESSVTMPKPPIILNRIDPAYKATQAHFEDVLKRYGSPVIVLDLIKQSEKREREVIVGNEYRHALDFLNTHIDDEYKIRYCALDYSHISKHRNLDVSTSLNEVATWAVNQTGFYCSKPSWKIIKGGDIVPFAEEDAREATEVSRLLGIPTFPMEQKGVLRTNCIDCLDRTNVAQFSAGVAALAQQLVVMGIRSSCRLDSSADIVRVLIDMYVEVGDHISLQYGGSEAHKKVEVGSDLGPMGKHKELLTSIRRYYSNAFTDRLKQDAINLFLGYYIPSRHPVPLWELESDYHLHNFHVKVHAAGALQAMKRYQREFADFPVDDTVSNFGETGDKSSDEQKVSSSLTRMEHVKLRSIQRTGTLTLWWKVAIQQYIQQRMWMSIGPPSYGDNASGFERLYQPEKLTQFDKYFARNWALPTRLSHEAQHAPSGDELAGHRKNPSTNIKLMRTIHEKEGFLGENFEVEVGDQKQTLGDIMDEISVADSKYSAETSSRLSGEVNSYQDGKSNLSATNTRDKINTGDSKPEGLVEEAELSFCQHKKFIGISENIQPDPIYLKYVSNPGTIRPNILSKALREGFSEYLKDTSLDADDVKGIQELTDSAHIGQEVKLGEYKGLNQSASAMAVATTIHEQYIRLLSIKDRGQLRDGLKDSYSNHNYSNTGLESSDLAEGVRASLASGWENLMRSEEVYRNVVDQKYMTSSKRSSLTDDDTLKLYSSFFDNTTHLSAIQKAFIKRGIDGSLSSSSLDYNQQQLDDLNIKNNRTPLMTASPPAACFTEGACQSETADSDPSEILMRLFTSEIGQRREVPAEFEQINEYLYARKDNKFIVFNATGVDCYENEPVTRTHSIRQDLELIQP